MKDSLIIRIHLLYILLYIIYTIYLLICTIYITLQCGTHTVGINEDIHELRETCDQTNFLFFWRDSNPKDCS